jgi:DNA-binding FrmR family transcriptional regulator
MESHHRKNISKRIHRLSGQLLGIDKMLNQNRLMSATLIQFLAADKAFYNLFYQQYKKELQADFILKINTLLNIQNLPAHHRQTLENIIAQLHRYQLPQLPKIIQQVEAIEQQYLP